MGIPSYYKKLIDTVPGLVTKYNSYDVNWLFMDFNCLIYHCLDMDNIQNISEWETTFIDSIITYCLKIINEVRPKGVFIAIDGVVPMAKMRQQRLRRFKSVWLDKTSKWDKNSITPGTLFMAKLNTRLREMVSTHDNWILSSSDEPGEGEHKIMTEWRKGTYKGNFAVYGLDADLIVLSMLGHECCNLEKIWLFREEMNAGKIIYDSVGNEIYNWFSIHELKKWIQSCSTPRSSICTSPCTSRTNPRTFILNYCFALSILGNDFLPSSLGLKMREDGHSELLTILRSLTNILVDDSLTISFAGVLELFTLLSMNEATRITTYITKKQMLANHIKHSEKSELNIGEHNWPLANIEESVLLDHKKLHTNWDDIYSNFFHDSIHTICKEYIYGIQWVWAYYIGNMKDVCYNWYYPYNLPPLWKWISSYLINNSITFPQQVHIKATDIKTVEQLAIVLPLESWSLIPPCIERHIPLLAPQYYPYTFGFESIGKRYFWECEPMIPIPSITDIKALIRNYHNGKVSNITYTS